MVRAFLKVYMELGSYFLFLQEQTKDIIISQRQQEEISRSSFCTRASGPRRTVPSLGMTYSMRLCDL